MPVTEKNFRNDPRRRAFVEVLSGFFLGPDRAAVEGEVIEMPYGEAMSVIHSNKARLCDGPARPAPPPPPAKVLQARRDAAAAELAAAEAALAKSGAPAASAPKQ